VSELKFELNRSIRRVFKDTNEEDIKFEIIIMPENVEETLKLKELEEVRRDNEKDGFYNDKWEDNKFIITLS